MRWDSSCTGERIEHGFTPVSTDVSERSCPRYWLADVWVALRDCSHPGILLQRHLCPASLRLLWFDMRAGCHIQNLGEREDEPNCGGSLSGGTRLQHSTWALLSVDGGWRSVCPVGC